MSTQAAAKTVRLRFSSARATLASVFRCTNMLNQAERVSQESGDQEPCGGGQRLGRAVESTRHGWL